MRGLSPALAALRVLLRMTVRPVIARARDLQAMRRGFDLDARLFSSPPGALYRAETIDGPAGPVPAVRASVAGGTGAATVLYLHGGAYVTGSSRTHRHLAAWLAHGIGGDALVPDYRLAPEHPFPAALDDALAAYRQLLRQRTPDGLVLAGDSAGGGLVFALLLRLVAEGLPAPAAVVAFSPWADLTGRAGSIRRNADRDVLLPHHRFAEVAAMYLQGHSAEDPLASPVLGRFRDPPPALILASDHELLTDDAVGLAAALRAAGGAVEIELLPGVPHAWPIFAGRLPEADRAVARAGAFLRRHLAG